MTSREEWLADQSATEKQKLMGYQEWSHWNVLNQIHSEAYLKELLNNLFGSVPEENIEVKNASDGPVGHSRSRLQSHLWKKQSQTPVCELNQPHHNFMLY